MIAIVCNPQYIDYMQDILSKYSFMKKDNTYRVVKIVKVVF